MKILLTHRYFWPDTPPYGAILRTIGESLAEQGHDVYVFASIPSYGGKQAASKRECLGGLTIRRAWVFQEKKSNPLVRVLNVLIYCVSLFVHILRTKPDAVMAATFPPVIAAWSASLAARLAGAKFVYHMQDIHPEVSKYSGGRLGKGGLLRLLTSLDNATLRRSAAVVVLSGDMARTLERREAIRNLPVHVINNFALDTFENGGSVPEQYRKPEGKLRIIFAGNLGKFQSLPLLAEGIAGCFDNHPELELFFLGDGVMKKRLQETWGAHPQVSFAPFLPFPEAKHLIAEANLGLVALTPDIIRVAYPSKVLTYLGLGVPILAMVEPESELARTVTDHGIGTVVPAHSPEAITDALSRLLDSGDGLHGCRRRVDDFYSHHFSKSAILPLWHRLFEQLEPGQ